MTRYKVIRQAVKRTFPTIDIGDTLSNAVEKMTHSNSSALVVKIGEEIVGLVTVTDVMFGLSDETMNLDSKISSFMTKCEPDVSKKTRNPCIQLDENQDPEKAIKLMYEAGVNHLFVTGFEGEIVGVVSSLELIKLFSKEH